MFGWYDIDKIVSQDSKQGMKVVIPTYKNRKHQRSHDKDLYVLDRRLVENACLQHLKRWRGIAKRYAKKILHHFWPLFRLDVFTFVVKSCDLQCLGYRCYNLEKIGFGNTKSSICKSNNGSFKVLFS